MRLLASVALPAFRITVALQAATRFLIADTTVARTPLTSATGCHRIAVESYITTFAMISGVALGTLRAYVSTVNIIQFIELTTRTEIVGFDGKWTGAFLTVFDGASRCDTVISCSATIAFWAHCMVFAHPTFTHHEIAGARVTVAVAFHAYMMILMIGTVDRHVHVSPSASLAGHSRVSLGTLAHFD